MLWRKNQFVRVLVVVEAIRVLIGVDSRLVVDEVGAGPFLLGQRIVIEELSRNRLIRLAGILLSGNVVGAG